MRNRYVEPKAINKEEFLEAVRKGGDGSVCSAIASAVGYIDDYDWLVGQLACLIDKRISHKIVGCAVTGIGSLARMHENADREQLLSILQPLLKDNEMSGKVEDAIDDIEMFSSKN